MISYYFKTLAWENLVEPTKIRSHISSWTVRTYLPPSIILPNVNTIKHTHETVSSGCTLQTFMIWGTYPTSSRPSSQSHSIPPSHTQLPATSGQQPLRLPNQFVYSCRSSQLAQEKTSSPTLSTPPSSRSSQHQLVNTTKYP